MRPYWQPYQERFIFFIIITYEIDFKKLEDRCARVAVKIHSYILEYHSKYPSCGFAVDSG